ncbi:MAG: ComF family protein [Pseudomonadota bacterium]
MVSFDAMLGRAAALLYPPVCPGCGAETGTPRTLCPACWRETIFLSRRGCQGCGRPIPELASGETSFRCDDCDAHGRFWSRGRAALAYSGTGRRLALSLKHGDRLDTVPMLAGWMLRAGGDLVAEADLIVPIPLHWTRRLKRRANQSAELARALCRLADKPRAFAPLLLRRNRATESQDGKDAAARRANLAGAITVAPGAARRVKGRRMLLVDDVLTTGATLSAATEVLESAGATDIDVLVMALVIREGAHHFAPDREDYPETEGG